MDTKLTGPQKQAYQALQEAVAYFGNQAQLARALGESPQTVSYWCQHLLAAPPRACISIETVTDGAVHRYALQPDVFGKPYPAWRALRRIFRYGTYRGTK
ncbi:MAG: Cro/CI family transcriptional regulator [Nannocystaceae bacterium]